MQIIPLNLDSVLLFLHNSKLAYYTDLGSGASFALWLPDVSTGLKYFHLTVFFLSLAATHRCC